MSETKEKWPDHSAYVFLAMWPFMTWLGVTCWWTYWMWFIVPLGAPKITWWHTFGLMAAWSLFKPNSASADGWEAVEKAKDRAIFWLVAIAMAWIAHLAGGEMAVTQ